MKNATLITNYKKPYGFNSAYTLSAMTSYLLAEEIRKAEKSLRKMSIYIKRIEYWSGEMTSERENMSYCE